jgi:CheY-like chemotaxis protein
MHVPSAEVPIVALVAQTKKRHCGTYLAAGMDACVMKPINAAELHAALAPLEVIEQNAREQDQISDQQ